MRALLALLFLVNVRHSSGDGQCATSRRIQPKSSHKAAIPFRVGAYENATLRYGGHYSFYVNADLIIRQHIQLFQLWHPGGTFLDVGGRNGEYARLADKYSYAILERDPPSHTARAKYARYQCDLIGDCPQPAPCRIDIIYCNNVVEHLLLPHRAFSTMASKLRVGGMLIIKTQWLWRYHAQRTYGDYFRFSPRALEYLCIQAGLNPVWSGYQQMKRGPTKLEVGGKPPKLDIPPEKLPLNLQLPVFIICYKPRPGERVVPFEEVGDKPVAEHPRFNLNFAQARSERETGV